LGQKKQGVLNNVAASFSQAILIVDESPSGSSRLNLAVSKVSVAGKSSIEPLRVVTATKPPYIGRNLTNLDIRCGQFA